MQSLLTPCYGTRAHHGPPGGCTSVALRFTLSAPWYGSGSVRIPLVLSLSRVPLPNARRAPAVPCVLDAHYSNLRGATKVANGAGFCEIFPTNPLVLYKI